jgi:hypothetical protein
MTAVVFTYTNSNDSRRPAQDTGLRSISAWDKAFGGELIFRLSSEEFPMR